MHFPKVTVICLCHNQKKFVTESIRSVLDQSYSRVELIVVDDGSSDGSKNVIRKMVNDNNLQFIDIEKSIGNCRAFNLGFKRSSGDYIIDLAADDLLHTNRIEEGLKTFEKEYIGVEFCNVMNVNPKGDQLSLHFNEQDNIPEGNLYLNLITSYFISPPGMMMKHSVLEELGGYDENLSYEDFDFWIRSSRNHLYGYTDKVLVKKRNVPNSLSKKQFRLLSTHQKSTLKVCKKIRQLNKTKEENLALRQRCFYEIKNCMKQGNLHLIPSFIKLII